MQVNKQTMSAKASFMVAKDLCIILIFCLLMMSFMKIGLRTIYVKEESLLYVTFASQILLYILLPSLARRYLANNNLNITKISAVANWEEIFFAFILGIILFLFAHGQDGIESWLVAKFNPSFAYSLWPFQEDAVAAWTIINSSFILHLIIGVLIAPVVEEFYFRKLLFTNLTNCIGIHKAALLSGVIFILVHLQHSHIISTFIFAVALCYLYVATKSVLLCTISHSVFNLIAIVTENFFLEYMIRSQEEMGSIYNWRFELVVWAVSIVFMIFVFYRFRSRLLSQKLMF